MGERVLWVALREQFGDILQPAGAAAIDVREDVLAEEEAYSLVAEVWMEGWCWGDIFAVGPYRE